MAALRMEGVATRNLDPNGGDLRVTLLDAPLSIFDNLDIFINATYPKGCREHIESFLATERIAGRMKRGSIVLLSSIYGVVGADYSLYAGTDMDMPVEYSFIKGGIIAMTRTLATKYAPVRVNCVSPGGVGDGQDQKFIERYCKRVPLGRMATPEDSAGPVVFLAGDKARYITGQNLIIDGGLCAW